MAIGLPIPKIDKPKVAGAKAPAAQSFSSQLNQQLSSAAGAVSGAVSGAFGSVSGAVGNIINDPLSAVGRAVNGDFRGIVNEAFGQGGLGVSGKAKSIAQESGFFGSKGVKPPTISGGDASQWGQINPKLLANIYLMADGVTADQSDVIVAPITDANLDFQLNWQSSFEGAGAESKAPALMALIQSGQIGIITQSLQAVLPEGDANGGAADQLVAGASGQLAQIAQKTKDFAKSLEGRTGITKLNSRQVFSGMPPISITFTLHLRAFKDAVSEVLDPYQKLLEWSLPVQLAQDGIIANTAAAAGGDGSLINALFPSKAPNFVGFRFAGNRYEPMVIESVSHPLDGQLDKNGVPLYRAVQIKLSTLTALDRADVSNVILR